MGEDLFRLISTGLLGVIVLLLLLAVSQLSRLQRALGAGEQKTPTDTGTETSSEGTEASRVVDEPDALAGPGSEAVEETGSPEMGDEGEPATPDEEGPFERDGRWWFRRDGDLLVYDEQREEWVDPSTAPVPQAEPEPAPEPMVAAAPAEIEPHPLDEARDWDGHDTRDPENDTAVPTATTPLEQAGSAPVPEPVSAPAPITETPELDEGQGEAGGQSEAGGHWKCPSCGVINGSTATSCRMCFAARP